MVCVNSKGHGEDPIRWRFNFLADSLCSFITLHRAECVHWRHIEYMSTNTHTVRASTETLVSQVPQAIKIKAPQKISTVSTLNYYSASSNLPICFFIHFLPLSSVYDLFNC